MQGSNDVPFAGSLLRKSSHTTYGRRGRASLAVKDGQHSERASYQGMEGGSSEVNVDSKDGPTVVKKQELDRNEALVAGFARGLTPDAANGTVTGVKRSGTGETTLEGDLDQTSGSLTGESS